ncbi:hypothetical protein COU54_03780 [Candidatus Pacearchaeota archaeon CG10_big_fil_rev_8_21_14_0_10_31_24]|nr:MAG: hypothetical protein COU54_03780 [Candidatus Pacearchaeota archaeon CG10_big_fil_rev_8_21_14_0_10_31_24]
MKKSVFRLLSLFLVLALFVSSLSFVVADLVSRGDGTFLDTVDGSIVDGYGNVIPSTTSPTSVPGTGGGSSPPKTIAQDGLFSSLMNSDFFSFFKDPKDSNVTGEYLKLLVLLLIILIIYSGLSYANFPESGIVRFLFAIIIGFLATIMITTQELVAALQSYTALGIALTLFFPILALAFVTFVVASKVDPLGLVVQRIAWVLYSVYLFIQTASLLIVKWYISTSAGIAGTSTSAALKNSVFGTNIFKFLFGNDFETNAAASGDNLVLIMLLVTSIIVFWVFVYKNAATTKWLIDAKRDADLQAYKTKVEKAGGKVDVDAAQVGK